MVAKTVAKARKSTHSKGKSMKNIRAMNTTNRSKIDQIEELGPVYLMWGKKRRKDKKTGKNIAKYYIRKNDRHLVWVKWANGFDDDRHIVWSAEPQDHFQDPELKRQIQSRIETKQVWPFPSIADGDKSGWQDRLAICKQEGYKLWQSSNKKEQGKSWRLLDGQGPQTGTSDASSTSDSEATTEDDEVEDDEV